MPRVLIPVEVITAVEKDLVIQGTVQSTRRVLKPNIIECVKAKLGVRYEFPLGWGFGVFVFGNAPDPLQSAEDDMVYITLYTPPRTNRGNLEGQNADRVNSVLDAIRECVLSKPTEKELGKKVAAHEGRRTFRTALGWQGPDGKELPEEVARNIAKFAASPKIQGGRKTRAKGRKAKHTRRRAGKK